MSQCKFKLFIHSIQGLKALSIENQYMALKLANCDLKSGKPQASLLRLYGEKGAVQNGAE